MQKTLKVAINAQLIPGSGVGGVENVLIGLVKALAQLDGPEQYVLIGPWEQPDWLQPYTGTNQRIISGPRPAERLHRVPRGLRPLALKARRALLNFLGSDILHSGPDIPLSDGFYEQLGCDVIHFPYQAFTLCALPSIFNPHDLQHLHFPQFFQPKQLLQRETIYREACRYSHTVVTASQWIKDDILEHYPVSPNKIQIIPWAAPSKPYTEPTDDKLASVQQKYGLNRPFTLYPAVSWPHKNHLRLLEALALLRDRDHIRVNLVCTGVLNPFYHSQIQPRILALNLAEQVQFVGQVPGEDLRALYRLAEFVTIPTLFEAASSMMFEAWQDRRPVTASTVTSLPEQAHGAALLFDPYSIEAIADAVKQMSTQPDLRADLVRRGDQRLLDFDWERTAKAYRAVYRRAALHPLTEEDQHLLSWDWMRNPTGEMNS
ncbi:MAG TPA: glycosyltransferase family 1 protein [Aggregatilineaceae bacterium]|nr:glycosyltransferase family 1 protein [Aggregatilineaceae bacterium]